jgi:hypothetical protein
MAAIRLRVVSLATLLIVTIASFGSVAQAQGPQVGSVTAGGLIDVILNNTQVLNNSPILNNITLNDIRVVEVDRSLNGAEINVLSDILNESDVLSDNVVIVRNVLNNNTVLRDFLNQNNIAVDRVVAIDVLSAPVTVFVMPARFSR